MPTPIDRQAVIRRHNPQVRAVDPFSALTVGNGEFAFNADVTGLQTFPESYRAKFPLCTVSHWGWHTAPNTTGLTRSDLKYEDFDTWGRAVGYATNSEGQKPLFDYLRENPHRLHLGQIGFLIHKSDGTLAAVSDLQAISQSLDLWTGILDSRFEVGGVAVTVRTVCHPEHDLVAFHVDSELIRDGRLQIRIAFPYASPSVDMADWSSPARHRSEYEQFGRNAVLIERTLDGDSYFVDARLGGPLAKFERQGAHEFFVSANGGTSLELTCRFSPSRPDSRATGVSHGDIERASERHWQSFWSDGGIVDLGGSTDPRAVELERRIVLSQYNTALHCAGSLPSQETGLLFNSWFGKFHLEMHWWHSVHFASWGHAALFRKSLSIYRRILPIAYDIAKRQGYRGARWPKMIGPDGFDSPSPVGPLLIWQQPHPIYYAELCYCAAPTAATLAEWRDVVFESADFMASYAVQDMHTNRFVLGPPMKTVSENQPPKTTLNPTFELAYWRFGLRVAQQWRERLGLARDSKWDDVLKGLAPLPLADNLYLLQEGLTNTYTEFNWEHPALVGALGMQPGDGVDHETMRRTVRRVMETWQWDRCWGWDFPMAAMAAARNGEPKLALDALMVNSPKNHYHSNGHVYQRENLTAYLPANGGLLAAVALMAAGWTDGPKHHAPGFPDDGTWSVRFEGITPFL